MKGPGYAKTESLDSVFYHILSSLVDHLGNMLISTDKGQDNNNWRTGNADYYMNITKKYSGDNFNA
ncbi:MAG TPA: hypothetical protein DIS98_00740 [Colwellia sp.]|nr:hypothetical protein [Colwellia sp.]